MSDFVYMWLSPKFRQFCKAVQTAYMLYPFSVTSWFRDPDRNKAVGGVPNSKHLLGIAIDIVPQNPDDRDALIRFFQVLEYEVIPEKDHIHIEA